MTLLSGAIEQPRLRQGLSHIDCPLQNRPLSSSNVASPSQQHNPHCRVYCNVIHEGRGRRWARRGRHSADIASLAFSMPLAGGPSFKALLSNEPNASGESSHGHSAQSGHSKITSVDPQASGEDIVVIHSPQELDEILGANQQKLVCLMCKAIGCRPCKVFARKYQRIAAAYSACIFLECTGDETIDLRKLMIQMGIRSTPTFRLYREGECIKTHVGIDDAKLKAALDSCLEEGEAVPTS